MTTSDTSHFSTISKIQLPSSRVLSNRTAKQPVLCGAGVEGVNGKFTKVSGKMVNDAPYFRNEAGFEISLAKGKQFWAILGPNGGAYYYAPAQVTVSSPPTTWTPHELAQGASPPVLKMEVEKEAGHTSALTPKAEEAASSEPRKLSRGTPGELAGEATGASTPCTDTPGRSEGTPVCKMNFMHTPPLDKFDMAEPLREASIPKENKFPAATPTSPPANSRDSRHTSCYEDNDVIDSPHAQPQRIPRQEKEEQRIPRQMMGFVQQGQMKSLLLTPTHPPMHSVNPLALTPVMTTPVLTANGQPPVMNLQPPTAPVGTVYIPSPMHAAQSAPQQMFSYGIQMQQPMHHGLLFDHNAVAVGAAVSPGLNLLAQNVYSGMSGFAVPPHSFTLPMAQAQPTHIYQRGPETQLLRPETNPAIMPPTQLRSSTSYEQPDRFPRPHSRSAVSDLGGEPVNGRPRTASSGVIAPPTSSSAPTALLSTAREHAPPKRPRFYRVAVSNGITYRMTANFKDKFEGQVAPSGFIVEAEVHDGMFIRCSNGLWLPKHYQQNVLLQPCDEVMQHYTVMLKPGISFRKSKDLNDLSDRDFAKFGDDVTVHSVEDNWAVVLSCGGRCIPGGLYLPLSIPCKDASTHHIALRKAQPLATNRNLAMSHREAIQTLVEEEQHRHLPIPDQSPPNDSDAPSGSIEVLSLPSSSNSADEAFVNPLHIARNESYDSQVSIYSG